MCLQLFTHVSLFEFFFLSGPRGVYMIGLLEGGIGRNRATVHS